MNPVISVITSVCNGAGDIDRTINSVLNQALSEYEYIIIDDGSSDRTLNALMRYANSDGRIKVLKNDYNLGLTASLNKCLGIADSRYVARIDSGDVAAKDRLTRQMDFLDCNGDVGIVGSNDIVIFKDFESYRISQRPLDDATITRCLMYRNCFSHSTLMIRRDVFNDIGTYETRYAQDYDLIIRAKQKYKIANLSDFLCIRVQSAGDITTKAWRKQELSVFNSKLRYFCKVNSTPIVKSLAFLNIPLNTARLAVPSGLKGFYNRHFSVSLPAGFDYDRIDDYYKLFDKVNNI